MPGTKTAPEVLVANISENLIGISVVDASGDGWSEGLKVTGGAITSAALIEAIVSAYQAASNASVFEVRQTLVWKGSRNPGNAVAAFRAEAQSGINLTFEDTDVLNAVAHQRLVAPVAATMSGNTDTPVYPLVTPMNELIAAYIALLGAGYSLETMQYTGRKERKNNTKIST